MDGCGNDTWVSIFGTYARVGYCAFKNKTGDKNKNKEMLRLRVGVEHHARIDHNYFYNYTYLKQEPDEPIKNGTECIQAGMYLEKREGKILWKNAPSYSVIEDNYFHKWYGETEMVSVKASKTIFRYNTIQDCNGTVTLRQADDCEVYGNFFLQQGNKLAGGIRVYGARHKIYNNYFSTGGLSSIRTGVALLSGNSDPDLDPQPARDTVVAFNSFFDCQNQSITIGTKNPVPPERCVIANNLIKSNSGVLVKYDAIPVEFKYEGNIMFGTDLGFEKPAGIMIVDPLSEVGNGTYRLAPKSPALKAATGAYDYINEDIYGGKRLGQKDIGAVEFSSGNMGARRLLTVADVGPGTETKDKNK